eukprot:9725061-Prorocentrum_lima.AAC.1
MDFFIYYTAPVQMVATLWDIEHPMHVWDDDKSCFITSHDEEEDDEMELYLPPRMARWHSECPHEYQADEQL